ncbi:hypothetical protein H9L21_14030 [Aeromicrobium senzhongii]|uniref:Mce-associated membrane protein n=1 Tax=Aeromicrobium senzhongii TaxID=2663859 RepID=A0ABX6SUC3_9ACTN|nr:hypothetical protein [Aeromicrobium senzhongii]MTB89696.1 hypothetical protein [Aeromicrobium senzhongii]QNL94182.1 hypothetical protein H9L21_14030 [Aeromicrobium senzhongii]
MIRGRSIVVGLVVVALVALAAGTALLVRGPQIPASADSASRQDVRAATERFATAINTYDVTDLDEYVERVEPLLTDELAEQFKASTRDLLAKFEAAKIVSKGKVGQVAIDSMDRDSAEVIAAITISTEPADVQFGQPRLRWRVSLVKQEGAWVVENFANIPVETTAPEEGAAP